MPEEKASVEISFDDIVNLNDRGIQLTMRKTNTKDLAVALRGARKAIQDRFFSNLSDRVGKMVKEEMRSSQRRGKGHTEDARVQVVGVVQQLILSGQVPPPPWPRLPKRAPRRRRKLSKRDLAMRRTAQAALKHQLSDLSFDEINRTFVWFANVARREGILALEDAVQTPDEFLSKGMQLLVDGTEPELIQTILTTWMESLLHEQKVKYQKVIEGITSLQSGYNPRIIEEKLKVLY